MIDVWQGPKYDPVLCTKVVWNQSLRSTISSQPIKVFLKATYGSVLWEKVFLKTS